MSRIRDWLIRSWAKSHDWRTQAKQEDLVFYAVQLRASLIGGDDDAVGIWAGSIIAALGVSGMSEQERDGIVSRHFADLIRAVGDEAAAAAPDRGTAS